MSITIYIFYCCCLARTVWPWIGRSYRRSQLLWWSNRIITMMGSRLFNLFFGPSCPSMFSVVWWHSHFHLAKVWLPGLTAISRINYRIQSCALNMANLVKLFGMLETYMSGTWSPLTAFQLWSQIWDHSPHHFLCLAISWSSLGEKSKLIVLWKAENLVCTHIA